MNDTLGATFGGNLRAQLVKAGLTQEALAERLKFKRAAPISIWENGHKLAGPKTVAKLAKAIGCSTADLMQGVETPYDALRGTTRGGLIDSDPDVQLWNKIGDAMPSALRRSFLALLEDVLRATRRRP